MRGLPCPHCGKEVFLLRAQDPAPVPPQPKAVGSFSRRFGLSRREAQVGDLIVQGLTNKEIAQKLGVGRQTAKNYVQDLFRKIGVQQRGQVALVSLGLRKPAPTEAP